ncbi:MAG: sulfatase-like hydrolase/transferase [Methylococcaceae bacterium]
MKHINLTIYFIGTWLFSVFLCINFLHDVPNETLRDQVHTIFVLFTYGVMYQAPAIISYWLLRRWRTFAISIAIILSLLGHLFVFADSHLFDLYAFHINGFVWNLLTTPGGIDSLGADQTNGLLIMGYVSTLLAVHICSLILSIKLPTFHITSARVIILFLIATLFERGIYGISRAELYGPVMDRGDAMPLYQPMKMNTFLSSLGVDIKKSSKIKLKESTGKLQYPKHKIVLSKVDKPFNIIMLVSESMRWDLLTPEIMPNASRFAQQSWNFTKHYSGGNGTRQGLFSLFYGIPGNYWDMFLRKRQGPVLFDVLNEYNYQYFIYTSAKFTYPELDQTIFSQIPSDKLIENNTGEPWKRDKLNTSTLINDINNRDPSKPFYGFIFYEATHARYSFPDNAIVHKDYLQTLDYAGLSRKELAPQVKGMKARYDNSAYGIDIQLQRIIDSLQKSGDIDNTIVIITGDHGEEFMERGRWGHNSAFTDWQVRVPMIISIPLTAPKTINQRTSHMDISTTLLSRLGVTNPVYDYSLGVDLASPVENRSVTVASWSDIGLINDYGKLVIPFKSTTQHQNLATDLNDNPIDGTLLASQMKPIIFKALKDARYYSR